LLARADRGLALANESKNDDGGHVRSDDHERDEQVAAHAALRIARARRTSKS
jgi:hypothetical protein